MEPIQNTINIPKIELPKGGGTVTGIGESFQPNSFSGTAGLTIPIATSPCRGTEPEITVNYSSGAGNGMFGIGFSLSIPNISRKTDKERPRYTDKDTFLLSKAEDLIPKLIQNEAGRWIPVEKTEGDYNVMEFRPRVEGLFARIERLTRLSDGDTFWKVTTAENIVSYYGKSENARIVNPNNPSHVYQWLIEETEDALGNRHYYEYKSEDTSNIPDDLNESGRLQTANKYIHIIKYGNYTNNERQENWHFELLFDYGERNLSDRNRIPYESDKSWIGREDPFSTFKAGFEIRTHRLCQGILMFHRFEDQFDGKPFLVYATRFEYEKSPIMTYLKMVTMAGYRRNKNGTYNHKELPPLEFSYSKADPTWLFDLNPEYTNEFKTGLIQVKLREELIYKGLKVSTEAMLIQDDANARWQIIDAEHSYFAEIEADKISLFDPERNPHFDQMAVEGGVMAPGYFDGSAGYQMIDLYGEGLPGILYTDENEARYWRPRGNGTYASGKVLAEFPIEGNLGYPQRSLQSLRGDGKLNLVVKEPQRSGYYELETEEGWKNYRTIENMPLEAFEPAAETLDVTGNGLGDLLLFNDQTTRIYPSNGDKGFDQAIETHQNQTLPVTIQGSQVEAIRFVDLFGDGLSHLVRVRNGAIDSWPNLGYGKFGSKISLNNAPVFEGDMDEKRLHLADIDGSGTADLIYAYFDHLEIFYNLGGNGFSETHHFELPRNYDELIQLNFADVLGTGTSALVLSYLTSQGDIEHLYYDFCNGIKPHLLIRQDNNMGATTAINYVSSTRFYLADRAGETPWLTPLHFPVQVVQKVETIDHISKSKLVSTFSYHEGYFDRIEREFKGFGRVEQTDTETFDLFSQDGLHGHAGFDSGKEALHIPPVRTITWYHTGAYLQEDTLSLHMQNQYYQGDTLADPLSDSVLEPPLNETNVQTKQEAWYALYGKSLRTEIYSQDEPMLFKILSNAIKSLEEGELDRAWLKAFQVYVPMREAHVDKIDENRWNIVDEKSRWTYLVHLKNSTYEIYDRTIKEHPYTVTEKNYAVRLIQPKEKSKHAVMFAFERESISRHYERNPVDPRTEHSFVLEVDEFGNELQHCTVTYPRRSTEQVMDNPAFKLYPEQQDLRSTAVINSVHNTTDDDYLLGTSIEQKTFEIGGLKLNSSQKCLTWDELNSQLRQAMQNQIPYHQPISGETKGARFLAWVQHFYCDDDLQNPLPLGQVTGLALTHHSEEAVFTNALFEGSPVKGQLLEEAGYRSRNDYWWKPSLIAHYYDAARFYLPKKTIDSFGAETTVDYDAHALVDVKTVDALGNKTTADIDYQTLQPWRITDLNDNHHEAIFDALGMVRATSVYGMEGSRKAGDLPLKQYRQPVQEDFESVLAHPQDYLQNAATYFYYDLFAWQQNRQPPTTVNIVRETHVRDLAKGEHSRLQLHISYSDGFGRDLQKKVKVGPGEAFIRNESEELQRDENSALMQQFSEERWLVSGRTVYNNKAKAVKQYEPFYSATARYESEQDLTDQGVTPIMFYDPLERLIRTEMPKGGLKQGIFSKVDFNPWGEKHYDANDTIKDAPYYLDNIDNPELPDNERDALLKAAGHHNTPEIQVLDSLGNAFLSISIHADKKGKKDFLYTHSVLDVEGNELVQTDPRLYRKNQETGTDDHNFTYTYAMDGEVIHTHSADAGERWVLSNVLDSSVHQWDARGFHISTNYDPLQRPLQTKVVGDDGAGLVLNQVVERYQYGEGEEDDKVLNLRGQVREVYDQAGRTWMEIYDIKGNLLGSERQLRTGYQEEVNWNEKTQETLMPEIHRMEQKFDALDRLVSDSNLYRREKEPEFTRLRRETPTYHPEGWLESVFLILPDESEHPVIEKIDYDAKGQRIQVDYANATRTRYHYDPQTYELLRLKTVRLTDDKTLQEIDYTYDPIGNITRLLDNSQNSVITNNQTVNPICDYTYDSLYRLIKATGRQHLALNGREYADSDAFKQSRYLNLNDTGQVENYMQKYHYDIGGNLLKINHTATNSWNRQMKVAENSNRAVQRKRVQGDQKVDDFFDAHGNCTSLENVRAIGWNYQDNISFVDLIQREDKKPNDSEYYVYDGNGNRVRKVSQTLKHGKYLEIEEKIYLGGLELKRIRTDTAENTAIQLERWSLSVTDDTQRVVQVHYWTLDDLQRETNDLNTSQWRYQYGNHLGSVSLELTDEGKIISYEEYFPYGGTVFIAGKGMLEKVVREVKLKTYRYSGKERDDSTGLYYYGLRYYSPWLCRWINPDPAGTVDGLNLFIFVGGNPINNVDVGGMNGTDIHKLSKRSKPTFKKRINTGIRPTIPQIIKPQLLLPTNLDDSDVSMEPSVRDTPIQSNPFRWETKSLTSISEELSSGLKDVLVNYGHPTTSTVQTYQDLANRMMFDLDFTHGSLTEETRKDLKLVFEASIPLHFQFNPFLGEPWAESVNTYSGAKTKIPLYSRMRRETTGMLKQVHISGRSLNEYLKEVSGRPAEIHHVLYKALFPKYANQTTNLMLTQRSKREREFGPGQHELMHMLGAAGHPNKFKFEDPAFITEYGNFLESHQISEMIVFGKQ